MSQIEVMEIRNIGFRNASLHTPEQRIKVMENQLIALGVDEKEFQDEEEDTEKLMEEMRKNPDEKKKEKQIDEAIKEAEELDQDIQKENLISRIIDKMNIPELTNRSKQRESLDQFNLRELHEMDETLINTSASFDNYKDVRKASRKYSVLKYDMDFKGATQDPIDMDLGW